MVMPDIHRKFLLTRNKADNDSAILESALITSKKEQSHAALAADLRAVSM